MARLVGLLLLLSLPLLGWAEHIIGGELSMKSLGKPGYYRIQMNQFWDEETAVPSAQESFLQVHIFRKQNPVLMATYYLDRRSKGAINYENEACAKAKKLVTLNAVFDNDIQLETERYTDPGGYYIVWERCCRNNAISNLANPIGVGMMFYLEFPPLVQNGVALPNSSPVFTTPSGNYICLNKPFTTTYDATDADGDELRYSLVTPYQGYTNATDLRDDNGTVRQSYPLVSWAPGYSAGSAIRGTPALSINPATGQLTVTATQVGYYLFCVQCDEYRGGKKIGSVRRDFVLPVIECPTNAPPTPVISLNGAPTQVAKLCAGTSMTLTTDQHPDWSYQWQQDGTNIEGAKAASLTVVDPGVYTVTKTFTKTCGSESKSAQTQVQVVAQPSASLRLLLADGTKEVKGPFCEGDQLLLSVSVVVTGDQYQWGSDGNRLPVTTSRLPITKTGLYSLSVTPGGTNCLATATQQVDFRPRPVATLTASATQVCQGETVRLTTLDNASYQYRWEPAAPAARATQAVEQAGTYQVTITTADGCSATSPVVFLITSPLPTVTLVPVGTLCASSSPVRLQATPAGGVWDGPGVGSGQFSPGQASVGQHKLLYTASSPQGCRRSETLTIDVSPPLVLNGLTHYRVQRNTTAQLVQQPNVAGATIQWKPAFSLDRADVATPLFQGGASQTYTVEAQTPTGCQATAIVEVIIVEQVYLPTAFSPNHDGINDVWKPLNIEGFPNCELSIFNRWGEVIYTAKGAGIAWDGTYNKIPVESGLYHYILKTDTASTHAYRGDITVLY